MLMQHLRRMARSVRPLAAVEPLKAERVQLLLEKLPGWQVSGDGKSIMRAFRFSGPGPTQAFASLISAMAAEAGHSPTIWIEGSSVICKLTTPVVGGLTILDFDLAHHLSLQG